MLRIWEQLIWNTIEPTTKTHIDFLFYTDTNYLAMLTYTDRDAANVISAHPWLWPTSSALHRNSSFFWIRGAAEDFYMLQWWIKLYMF